MNKNIAFTMADRLSRLLNGLMGYRTTLIVSKDEKKGNTRALARIKGLLPCLARLAGNVPPCLSDLPLTKRYSIVLFGRVHSARSRYSPIALLPSRAAFTMAEILLSLTIIGVVAAITLPSLTGNINERTWNTQRKALYARFSQALALMPALNGYGTYTAATSSASAIDNVAETFITAGLSKVLKINNICDSEHLTDCGIVSSYTNLIGSKNSFPTRLSELNSMFTGSFQGIYKNPQKEIDTKAAAFESTNGESIAVYYNPFCLPAHASSRGSAYYTQPYMCVNFIYDLNGNKGPNTVGKDMGFITALYPTDSIVVAPMPLTKDAYIYAVTASTASKYCTQQDKESRLPNTEELSSLFYNINLTGMPALEYMSSTQPTLGQYWRHHLATGLRAPDSLIHAINVRCIKR